MSTPPNSKFVQIVTWNREHLVAKTVNNRMKYKDLTKEYLRECFNYNPDTGHAIWRVRPRHHFTSDRGMKSSNTRMAGKIAGTPQQRGYLQVGIAGNRYKLHRLIFLYMTGQLPQGEVDHINHDTSDNIWANLRDVCHGENMMNRRKNKNSPTGVTGVYWHNASNMWTASIRRNGKTKYLGIFRDFDDACSVRMAAQDKYGFHANHGRSLT